MRTTSAPRLAPILPTRIVWSAFVPSANLIRMRIFLGVVRSVAEVQTAECHGTSVQQQHRLHCVQDAFCRQRILGESFFASYFIINSFLGLLRGDFLRRMQEDRKLLRFAELTLGFLRNNPSSLLELDRTPNWPDFALVATIFLLKNYNFQWSICSFVNYFAPYPSSLWRHRIRGIGRRETPWRLDTEEQATPTRSRLFYWRASTKYSSDSLQRVRTRSVLSIPPPRTVRTSWNSTSSSQKTRFVVVVSWQHVSFRLRSSTTTSMCSSTSRSVAALLQRMEMTLTSTKSPSRISNSDKWSSSWFVFFPSLLLAQLTGYFSRCRVRNL